MTSDLRLLRAMAIPICATASSRGDEAPSGRKLPLRGVLPVRFPSRIVRCSGAGGRLARRGIREHARDAACACVADHSGAESPSWR